MNEREQIYNLQIIGGGPAGIGPLVAADRVCGLQRFLGEDGGVALINPNRRLGSGGLHGLKITSNSPGYDFLEGIRADGDLASVLRREPAKVLERAGHNPLPLPHVAEFLEDLGREIGHALETDRNSAFIEADTGVFQIGIYDDGHGGVIFESESLDKPLGKYQDFGPRHVLARSRHLVIATGAREELQYKDYEAKLVTSQNVLSEEGIGEIQNRTREFPGSPIVIVGNSHSAWSVAHKLRKAVGDTEIHLFSKNGVKVFFSSRQEAYQAGYSFDENDVCVKTERVNRFLGIRGDAKELFLRSQNGGENKVHLHTYRWGEESYKEFETFLNAATTIVQATGYRPNELYIYDYSGYIGHGLAGASDSTYTDELARIIGEEVGDSPIPGAYAIGLGRTRLSTKTIGGEPNAQGKSIDGVNIYHGPVGEIIIEGIRSNDHPRFDDEGFVKVLPSGNSYHDRVIIPKYNL